MKHFHGQQKVDPGLYLHARNLKFESKQEVGTLPGGEHELYYGVPPVALLVVGPLLGLAYAIFLPLIGFVMLGRLVGGKLLQLSAEAARSSVRVLRPAWEPALAYFSRSKKKSEKQDDDWSRETEKRLEVEQDEE